MHSPSKDILVDFLITGTRQVYEHIFVNVFNYNLTPSTLLRFVVVFRPRPRQERHHTQVQKLSYHTIIQPILVGRILWGALQARQAVNFHEIHAVKLVEAHHVLWRTRRFDWQKIQAKQLKMT
jgi:hypothetical protein